MHTQEARAAKLQRLSTVVRRNALEQGLPQKKQFSKVSTLVHFPYKYKLTIHATLRSIFRLHHVRRRQNRHEQDKGQLHPQHTAAPSSRRPGALPKHADRYKEHAGEGGGGSSRCSEQPDRKKRKKSQ